VSSLLVEVRSDSRLSVDISDRVFPAGVPPVQGEAVAAGPRFILKHDPERI
jgi:hypothetical protein